MSTKTRKPKKTIETTPLAAVLAEASEPAQPVNLDIAGIANQLIERLNADEVRVEGARQGVRMLRDQLLNVVNTASQVTKK